MRPRLVLFAVAAGVVVSAAGCRATAGSGVVGPVAAPPASSGPASPAPDPGTPTPGGSGATTPPPAHTPTPAGTPSPAHTPPRITECDRAAGLDVAPGSTDAGSGHRRLVIVFTNTSGRTCDLAGYPGVDALDAGGHSVAHATRTPRGYLGGLPAGQQPAAVTLSPGESASAVVEAVAFGADGGSCTPYAGLLVTAPDDTRSVRVAWAGTDACAALQVHPVVAGADG